MEGRILHLGARAYGDPGVASNLTIFHWSSLCKLKKKAAKGNHTLATGDQRHGKGTKGG